LPTDLPTNEGDTSSIKNGSSNIEHQSNQLRRLREVLEEVLELVDDIDFEDEDWGTPDAERESAQ
jgi:hypothetical protein